MIRFALLLAGLSLACPAASDAGGIFQRAPKVGEWSRFFLEMDMEDVEDFETTILVKCTGSENIDDEPHLWIDLSHEQAIGDDSIRVCYRLLIPTERFGRGHSTLRYAVRGTLAADSNKRVLTDEELRSLKDEYEFSIIRVVTAPLQKPKALKRRREIPYQKGTLDCRGESGRAAAEPSLSALTAEHWLHEDALWGLGGFHLKRDLDDGDTPVDISLIYEDGGRNTGD